MPSLRLGARACTGFLLALLAGSGGAWAQTSRPESEFSEASAGKTPAASRSADDFRTRSTMTGDWGGARKAIEDLGIRVELTLAHQFQQNFRGGLQTDNGHRFSGTLDYALDFDFEKMGLLKGASFYIKARSGYSDGINPDKVGALFNTNADAFEDEPIFVRKWWYEQKLLDGKIELQIGRIQSHKDHFDVSLYANHEDEDFLNLLSTRNPTVPHANGLGAFVKVAPVDWWYVQAAAIDAQVVKRTKTGFDTAFHDEAWYNVFFETGFLPNWETPRGSMPGSYRIGLWYDPRVLPIFMNTLEGRRRQRYRGNDVGFYVGFDQMIWKENADRDDQQGLGIFARWGASHRDINRIGHYWQVGASYRGLISGRDDDVVGFAVSQAILSRKYREEVHEDADRETVWEWYYQFQVTPWCTVAPDFQVIQNPGGDKTDRDAIVGGVRVFITF